MLGTRTGRPKIMAEDDSGTVDVGHETGQDTHSLDSAVSLRREGLSLRDIEDRTGIPRTTLDRHFKREGIKKGQVSKLPNPDMGRDNPNPNPHPSNSVMEQPQQFSMSPAIIPSGPGVYLSHSAIANLRSMMTKPQQRVFDGQLGVAEQEMRNDGHSMPMGPYRFNPENPLVNKLMQIAEAKEVKGLLGLGGDAETVKRLDRLERKLDGNKEFDTALKLIQFIHQTQPGQKGIGQVIGEVGVAMEALRKINPGNPQWSAEDYIKVQEAAAKRELEMVDKRQKNEMYGNILGTISKGVDMLKNNPKAQRIADDLTDRVHQKIRGSNPGHPPGFMCPNCYEEKGAQVFIDVSDSPDVAVCPICKSEYPKQFNDVGEEELSEEDAERLKETRHPHWRLLEQQNAKAGGETD